MLVDQVGVDVLSPVRARVLDEACGVDVPTQSARTSESTTVEALRINVLGVVKRSKKRRRKACPSSEKKKDGSSSIREF